MLTQYIGELAAIGTSIAFAFASTLFTISGRAFGSSLVNRTRLLMALLAVMLVHFFWYGELIPNDAGMQPWFWLSVSGLIGFAIGDGLLFQAFLLIGARLSMLIFSVSPVIGALLAWMFLGETLGWLDLLGIVITISGLALVVTEPREKAKNNEIPERGYLYGFLFALGGAFGQASGQVFAKIGLANGFPTFSALLIRIMAATIMIWVLALSQKQLVSSYRNLKANPRVLGVLSIAAILGPIIGVWLSLIAVQNSPVGIATTLSSLTPIFLIPIAYFVFGEKISLQALIGTLIAVGGSSLLFF